MPKIKVSSGSYDGAGRFIPGCKVTVTENVGGGLATIYSDQAGTALGNPFKADDSGTWEFYADPNLYDISVQRRGSAIFTQEAVAVGFIPYPERPGGSFNVSTTVTAAGAYTTTTTPYLRGEDSNPYTLGTGIGNPITFNDEGASNPPSVINGVEFAQSKNLTGIDGSDHSYVAMKYTGNFARDFICYFTVSHYPTFVGSQDLRIVTVDGDDWESGVYTQKTASDSAHYEWSALFNLNHNNGMQVAVVRVDPGDVIVPLVYMQDSTIHFIPDVKLVIKP